MAQVPPEETERNLALYNDFKAGFSYIDLITKYRISQARIYQIVKKMMVREALKPLGKEKEHGTNR